MGIQYGLLQVTINNATKYDINVDDVYLAWGHYENTKGPANIKAGNSQLIYIRGALTSGCEIYIDYEISAFPHPRPCIFKVHANGNYDGSQFINVDPLYYEDSCFGEYFYAKLKKTMTGIVWRQEVTISQSRSPVKK